jgi:alpha-tubulin suppressor-like RCC1 family protein
VPCARANGVSLTLGAHGTLEDKAPSNAWTECDPETQTIGTVAVTPSEDKDAELGMKLVMAVTKARPEDCSANDDPPYDGCIVARRTLRYAEHKTLYLSIPLDLDCRGTPCTKDSTCYRADICRDARLPDAEQCATSFESCGLEALRALGEESPAALPVVVLPSSDLSAGGDHVCAIAEGKAYCWGSSTEGQVGVNTIAQASPFAVEGFRWKQISAGADHSCGIEANAGALFCWGSNAFGQFGNGATGHSSLPTPAGSGMRFDMISAGRRHTCGITLEGELYCWGDNSQQAVGPDCTPGDTNAAACLTALEPQRVSEFSDWRLVSAGNEFTCALRATGELYCWGGGVDGRLGTDDFLGPVSTFLPGPFAPSSPSDPDQHDSATHLLALSSATPGVPFNPRVSLVLSPSGRPWGSVSSGAYHVCAIDTAGELACWGRNSQRQTGVDIATPLFVPTEVVSPASQLQDPDVPTRWRVVTGGEDHSCGIAQDGRLFCWGGNDRGQVGVVTNPVKAPTLVDESRDWAAVSAGRGFTCARHTEGTLYCWGRGDVGQLGNGQLTDRPSPSPVPLGGSGGMGGTGGSAGTGGTGGSGGASGQAGTGGAPDCGGTAEPVTVPLPGGLLAAGDSHACSYFSALDCNNDADGDATRCWGSGDWGQTGFDIGDICPPDQPINSSLSSTQPDMLSAGARHSCALYNSTLYCWGDNSFGQLGIDPIQVSSTSVPQEVKRSDGTPLLFTSMSAGASHTCGIAAETPGGPSRLYCWGKNDLLALGHACEPANGCWAPQLVDANISNWRVVSAGSDFTCAVRDGGELYCWGRSNSGQLGLGGSNFPLTRNFDPNTSLVPSPCGVPWLVVSAGVRHACAIDNSNALWCWGDNEAFRTGSPDEGAIVASPRKVASNKPWVRVSVGRLHTCGVQQGEENNLSYVYCWGDNGSGQLGQLGQRTYEPQLVNDVLDYPFWAQIDGLDAGRDFTCIVGADSYFNTGTFCWGDNSSRQIGDGFSYCFTPERSAFSPQEVTCGVTGGLVANQHAYTPTRRSGALLCPNDEAYDPWQCDDETLLRAPYPKHASGLSFVELFERLGLDEFA